MPIVTTVLQRAMLQRMVRGIDNRSLYNALAGYQEIRELRLILQTYPEVIAEASKLAGDTRDVQLAIDRVTREMAGSSSMRR